MKPLIPTAFTGIPPLPGNRPEPQGMRVHPGLPAFGRPMLPPSLPRTVPTVTVYPDGLVNLNTEASGLVAATRAVCLHAPEPVRAGRTPNLWEIAPGTCHRLVPVAKDKPQGSMRFRADLYPQPGRYLLTPLVGRSDRFALVPG